MSPRSKAPDLAAQYAQEKQGISEWIERHIGGRVARVERLERWRPLWRVDTDQGGKLRSYLVRGARTLEAHSFSLAHEMRAMAVLEANGIPVPHVYGLIDSPEAFVMDWAEGGRDPALVQPSIEQASTISPERWKATLKYMEVLARIHDIPVERFTGKIVEADIPVTPESIGLGEVERLYKVAGQIGIVDALTEFFMSWLRRNVPKHRSECVFVLGDACQFLSVGENITAVLDVEMAHFGDPMRDLACLRARHPVENLGDVHALLRHYEKVTGKALDLPVLAFYSVAFLTVAYISTILGVRRPVAGGDWLESASQSWFVARRGLEAMAEIEGVTLDEFELPNPCVTPIEDLIVDKLMAEIIRLPTSDAFADWQRDVLAGLPRYLRHQIHFGRWMEAESLLEIGELTGKHPADLVEAEAMLMEFVTKATAAQDGRLIKLFHRDLLRRCLVVAGEGASRDHFMMVKLEPTLELRAPST